MKPRGPSSSDEINKATKRAKRQAKAKPQANGADETTKAKDDAEFAARLKEAAAGVDDAAKKKRAAEAKIEKLSKLNKLDYDLQRREAAKELELPVVRLDEHVKHERGGRTGSEGGRPHEPPVVEPWPEPVDGAALADEIAATFRRHFVLPQRADQAIALWVIHTHALDAAGISPRLIFQSFVAGAGKTNGLRLLDTLVAKPLSSDSPTTASTFRAIEKWHPTLIYDEADNYLPKNNELRGILNSGHMRGGQAMRERARQDGGYITELFSTWSALAIGYKGKLIDTLASRAILIKMQPARRKDRFTRYPHRKKPYADLGRRAARWVADNIEALRTTEITLPDEVYLRTGDNWEPLLIVATVLGGNWPSHARETALTLTDPGAIQDYKVLALSDVRDMMGLRERISSEEAANLLGKMEHRRWPDFNGYERPLSKFQLSRWLGELGVVSVNIRDDDEPGPVVKGYKRPELEEAWEKYLPPLKQA